MKAATTRASIVVTGGRGRLGQALLAAAPSRAVSWDRPRFDLDDPGSLVRLVEEDRPAIVIHSAAMTATDEAARWPERALRRNGEAVTALARACRRTNSGLVLVSSNEVFDGRRTDGRGYAEDDERVAINPYGRSKLAGELGAQEAFDGRDGLWIVRTAWLYGPPGGDFPDKITAAADGLPDGEPLAVVADEFGSPTSTTDLATAMLALVERSPGGVFHLVNRGVASRLDWAREVLARRRPGRELRPIPGSHYERASQPPAWGVLDGGRADALGIELRPWRAALAEHLQRSG